MLARFGEYLSVERGLTAPVIEAYTRWSARSSSRSSVPGRSQILVTSDLTHLVVRHRQQAEGVLVPIQVHGSLGKVVGVCEYVIECLTTLV